MQQQDETKTYTDCPAVTSDMQEITSNVLHGTIASTFLDTRHVRGSDLLETCWNTWWHSVTAARMGLGLELELRPRDGKPVALAPPAVLLLQLLPSVKQG